MSYLTRQQMLDIIARGESVIYKRATITKASEVPTQDEIDEYEAERLQAEYPLAAVNLPFSTEIQFSALYTEYATHTVTEPLEFTPDTVGARAGCCSTVRLIADGTSAITFDGISEITTSSGYDNTEDTLNTLIFFHDGLNYYVNIFQAVA